MEDFGSALEKNVAELTVMDVYDIAAVVGQEFERIIDQYGCEALSRLMPKVVRVLEILEVMVSRNSISPETEELRLELDKLRMERIDRLEKDNKHRKELELVEDVWRGEAQDLLCQIAQLQEENKTLLTNLSSKDPLSEEDLQRHEGMTERERQVMKKLKEVVDKQRDEIRAKDREITLKNEDIEALQQQQSRLMKINHDLRHKISVMETQGKAMIEQKVELEAGAQTQSQEVNALRQEVALLREHLQRGLPAPDPEESKPLPASPAEINKTCIGAGAKSCSERGDPAEGEGFDPETFSSEGQNSGEEEEEEAVLFWTGGKITEKQIPVDHELALCHQETMGNEDMPAVFQYFTKEALCGEDHGTLDPKDPNRPRFTLQELRDVLHERNELKAKVFMLQEEIAYYKSEETEEEFVVSTPSPSPDPSSHSSVPPESGIKRLFSFFSRDKQRSSQQRVSIGGGLGAWPRRDDDYTEQAQEAIQHF